MSVQNRETKLASPFLSNTCCHVASDLFAMYTQGFIQGGGKPGISPLKQKFPLSSRSPPSLKDCPPDRAASLICDGRVGHSLPLIWKMSCGIFIDIGICLPLPSFSSHTPPLFHKCLSPTPDSPPPPPPKRKILYETLIPMPKCPVSIMWQSQVDNVHSKWVNSMSYISRMLY